VNFSEETPQVAEVKHIAIETRSRKKLVCYELPSDVVNIIPEKFAIEMRAAVEHSIWKGFLTGAFTLLVPLSKLMIDHKPGIEGMTVVAAFGGCSALLVISAVMTWRTWESPQIRTERFAKWLHEQVNRRE
jgi:hypothetical protein